MGLLSRKLVQDDSDNRGNFGNGFNRGPFATPNLPKLEIYVKGTNRINVIPYRIATKNHPRVIAGKAKIGDLDYRLVYFVHSNVGPSKQGVICAKETFGKPCPVCDYKRRMREEGEAERDATKTKIAEDIYPSKKVALVVQDLRADDPKALRQTVLSYALFMRKLEQKQADCEEGGAVINYPDTGVDGSVVNFRASEEKKNGMTYNDYREFAFVARDPEESVDESLVDLAPSLDKGLIVPNYKDVEAILFGEPETEEDEPETAPVPKTTQKVASVVKDDVKVIDENPDNDPPARRRAVPAEPVATECPEGGKFGEDTDTFKKCTKCPLYTQCNAKYETTH